MKCVLLGIFLLCASVLTGLKASVPHIDDGSIVALKLRVEILLEKGVSPTDVAKEIFCNLGDGQYYSKTAFLDAFQPFIHEGLWPDFENGWTAIYDAIEAGSVRRLSSERETGHIRCFFGTMMTLWRGQDDCLEQQMTSTFSFFNFPTHMNLIRAADEALATKIDLFFEGA